MKSYHLKRWVLPLAMVTLLSGIQSSEAGSFKERIMGNGPRKKSVLPRQRCSKRKPP
ncbi:hypothetical protein M5E89_06750 [Acidaminococcus intestini]|nr:hypothetical protein M5E89_06750 [Acidaminococcus intestini]